MRKYIFSTQLTDKTSTWGWMETNEYLPSKFLQKLVENIDDDIFFRAERRIIGQRRSMEFHSGVDIHKHLRVKVNVSTYQEREVY